MKNKLNIGIVTSTRADFFLLEKIINHLRKKSNLSIIVTGSHLSKKHGYSYQYISKIKNCEKIKVRIKVEDTSQKSIVNNSGVIFKFCSKMFSKKNIQLLLILGDRFEILPFAASALVFNIPIAHIHGGEVTHGSIDDQIRHALSKLSNFHFTAHQDYKKRLAQMGELEKNIFNYGSPGVENILNTKFFSKTNLEKKFNFNFGEKNVLVNFHPETNSKKNISKQFKVILDSCKNFKDVTFIFTYPNFDNKSNIIINLLSRYSKFQKNFFVIKNFGQKAFFSIIKNVDFVMGNSSSGIIEVPVLKKPTLNLGIRQSGRIKAQSIFDCKIEKKSIIRLTKLLLDKKFIKKIKYKKYLKLNTSKNISNKLLHLNLTKVFPKKFIDKNQFKRKN